jgi:hypothetical protein
MAASGQHSRSLPPGWASMDEPCLHSQDCGCLKKASKTASGEAPMMAL